MDIDFGVIYTKQNGNRIKVTLNKFKGQEYLHIREYGMDGDTGKLFPLPKGITIDPSYVDSLIEMLETVSEVLGNQNRPKNQLILNLDNKEE